MTLHSFLWWVICTSSSTSSSFRRTQAAWEERDVSLLPRGLGTRLHEQLQRFRIQHKTSDQAQPVKYVSTGMSWHKTCFVGTRTGVAGSAMVTPFFHVTAHFVASFPGHSQILSLLWRNCEIKSGSSLRTRLLSWPTGVAYLCPSCVLAPRLNCNSTKTIMSFLKVLLMPYRN